MCDPGISEKLDVCGEELQGTETAKMIVLVLA